jgi:aminomethyltransferase
MFLNERGTIEDDCIVYRLPDRNMIVVNASNREKDFAHIGRHLARFDCTLEDVSDDIALLALQGPECAAVLQPLTATKLRSIAYYHFAIGDVAGVSDVIISRTGYTGEDGFELYFPVAHASRIWEALTRGGRVTPAGLGARDSLRLEAGMALYGNDIDDTTTPLEARLAWTVKMDKGDFVGRSALEAQKARGVDRRLSGFSTTERIIPRPGYPVYVGGERTGEVRSGAMSPTLGVAIGTVYLPAAHARDGESIELEIRGKRVPCTVAKMPFYKRAAGT